MGVRGIASLVSGDVDGHSVRRDACRRRPIRDGYVALKRWLDTVPPDHIALRRSQAELFFRRIGITFAVYGDAEATERLIPFDIIPRVHHQAGMARAEARAGAARRTR